MSLDHDTQCAAIEQLQRRIWAAVVARYRERQTSGLTQKHIADQLGIAPPQISVWLNDPTAMTIKAAARLMLAMGAELELSALEATLTASPSA
ncbi:helix-turn-helix transcriptional regulator [Caulobacter sp.]|uniref:helix-turn-helix domain-containing protein n=1 Tax=Caulobacter sp. TaxID=78 RepID=UPI001B11BEC8|nr:helix-turn-helix transcriptional regulator [Caulobacter sp.]MBO9544599.1 helix-turn-helix transcriptional regulator [Caulobacter sp.]